MDKLKHIEVNTTTAGLYFACYVYRRCGETEYDEDYSEFYKINCVEPNKSKTDVVREARRIAEACNVKLINLIDFNASVPLVESLALMKRS